MMTTTRLRLLSIVLILGCQFGAEDGGEAVGSQPRNFEDVFETVGSVSLEETPQVVNVTIAVVESADGGFLIADAGESQIRRYDSDGRLVWASGGHGDGPGEFREAVAVAEDGSGGVVAFDRMSRLERFDGNSGRHLRSSQTGIRNVGTAHRLGGDTLLITGHHPDGPLGPRIHLWDLSDDSILWSRFQPLDRVANRDAGVVAGWSDVALVGDELMVTFATVDTLYLFSRSGDLRGQIPFPTSGFRRVADRSEGRMTSPDQLSEWLSTFDVTGRVFHLGGDSLLVGYFSMEALEPFTVSWHLLGMTRSGRRLFEIRDAPKPLAFLRSERLMVFEDPENLLPGDWIVTRIRP